MSPHYQFVHKALAKISLTSPPELLRALFEGAAGPILVEELWGELSTDRDNPPVARWLPADEVDGRVDGIAIVGMPPPKHQTEAWFAAIVFDHESVRFYTLEKGFEGTETMLGGWHDEGASHANYGPGPAPELGAFVEAVVGLLQ